MQAADLCAGPILPEPERNWRQIASFIARAVHSPRESPTTSPSSINYVAYRQYMPYPQYHLFEGGGYAGEVDDNQGNGEGPSA